MCPLCCVPVKRVTDVNPSDDLRFYDDNSKKLYLWYTKEREEKNEKSNEKEPSSESLDDLELCEPRIVDNRARSIQSSVKPRVLDFSFEIPNNPSPENFKSDNELIDEKILIQDSVVSPISKERLVKYMKDIQRRIQNDEEENMSENNPINLPKAFTTRSIKKVNSLS